MGQALERGSREEDSWKGRVEQFAQRYPDKFLDLHTRLNQELPSGWEKHVPVSASETGVRQHCSHTSCTGLFS